LGAVSTAAASSGRTNHCHPEPGGPAKPSGCDQSHTCCAKVPADDHIGIAVAPGMTGASAAMPSVDVLPEVPAHPHPQPPPHRYAPPLFLLHAALLL
jgi:hypothetical protein